MFMFWCLLGEVWKRRKKWDRYICLARLLHANFLTDTLGNKFEITFARLGWILHSLRFISAYVNLLKGCLLYRLAVDFDFEVIRGSFVTCSDNVHGGGKREGLILAFHVTVHNRNATSELFGGISFEFAHHTEVKFS